MIATFKRLLAIKRYDSNIFLCFLTMVVSILLWFIFTALTLIWLYIGNINNTLICGLITIIFNCAILFVINYAKKYPSRCEKCNRGNIKHIGEDFTGFTWINIYECDNCGEEFI